MTAHLLKRDHAIPVDWDRSGLPAWTYRSQALLDLEREHVFLNHWQIVGHVADIPAPGDFLTLDLLGERAVVVRGTDGEVRGFLNLCRHRGSRVVAAERGHCRNALVCPFHGWVYNLDGTLRGAAQPGSFPALDRHAFGLRPVETGVWMGFIFVRFLPGPQGSLDAFLAPIAGEFGRYRTETMVPAGDRWTETIPVNWKSVRDVDNEGYHVAMAHPALNDLYGTGYHDEPFVNGIGRSVGLYNPSGGRRWSVRHYRKTLSFAPHLPPELREVWLYYSLFPNTVISTTPETVQFYQEFPLAPGRTIVRGAIYRYPEESRARRAARYLARRIDRETTGEDIQLTIWSNESMKSDHFEGFYLSDLEYGVRSHHDHLRAALPVMRIDDAPEEKDLRALNDALGAGRG
jgi:phenylpropionate dioxygenase-like ring-hydroxylating dioxygenase large terminal subunit